MSWNKKKLIINKTFLAYVMLCLIVIVSNRGYRLYLPYKYQYIHMQIFSIFSVISFFFFLLLFKWTNRNDRFINIYLVVWVLGFAIPQLLYTYAKYGQGLSEYYSASQHFFFFIWIAPLLLVFKKNNIYKVLEIITNITVIGYCSLIFNAIMKNYTGMMLLRISSENMAWRNGTIRIVDCAVFTPFAIAYLFAKHLKSRKKIDLIRILIILIGQIYVEKTRMGTVALIFMIISMILLSKKHKLSKIATWIILGIGGVFSVLLGTINQVLSRFSVQNNGNSTLYRLNELEFYIKQFLDNKYLGIGNISPEKIMQNYNLMYWQNHNFEDIGVIGLLGMAGLLGVIIVFIVPMIRMIYILKKTQKEICVEEELLFCMLIGLVAYFIITSITLLITNYQRMPCFVVTIALAEYFWVMHKERLNKGGI